MIVKELKGVFVVVRELKGIFMFHQGHSAEVICLHFTSSGERLLTGSFDHTVALWDTEIRKLVSSLNRLST